MNGYSARVARLSDAELKAALAKCSADWMDYCDPATDRYYWYRALLEEDRDRQPSKYARRDDGDGPRLRMGLM